jgi:hypothetical protein
MADGKWQMADGRWQMADGGWQMLNGYKAGTSGTEHRFYEASIS